MAIHPKLSSSPAPRQHQEPRRNLTPQQATEISVWTEQAAQSLQNLYISSAQSEQPLAIPVDADHGHVEQTPTPLRLRNTGGVDVKESTRVVYRRRETLRRDGLNRREALLKGKEGSRRRQRWENDRLLNNPWAQQPSATDWQVQPTYPRHETMPYYLAPLWDTHYAAKEQARVSRRKAHARAKNSGSHNDTRTDAADAGMYQIPKDLRLKLKHARAAKGLLQDLEEDIREFVQKWNEKQTAPSQTEAMNTEGEDTDVDDEEDEIVFVGRKNAAKPPRDSHNRDQDTTGENDGEKLVFESPVDDQGAGFGRWLVHSLASYYGLRTWSVTVGNPPRREAYVGINPVAQERQKDSSSSTRMATDRLAGTRHTLPRPLYVSV